MLISAVMPIMSIYRLPHGQYGYRGHVINLPQDLQAFAKTLPRLPNELDILIVRKEGSDNTHCDFRVRRSKVLCALQWLKQHNKYYRDIHIDLAAVSQLPRDGDLEGLTTVQDTLLEKEEQQSSNEKDNHEVGTFVPIAVQSMNEEEAVHTSIRHLTRSRLCRGRAGETIP